MDVALTNSIVNTATALASAKTSDAVYVTVLKKAMDDALGFALNYTGSAESA